MNKVRAKMTVSEIRRYRGSIYNQETKQHTVHEMQAVKMQVVAGGNPEDNTYASATPSGTLELSITNPDTVGFFDLGQSFYVDFTPA